MKTQLLPVENDIAIDIVAIPNSEMMEQALALNQRFVAENAQSFPLNTKDCIPHITLAMGAVAHSDLPDIMDKVAAIAQRLTTIPIYVRDIYKIQLPDKQEIFGLDFEKTPQLQLLHEELMECILPHLVQPSRKGIHSIRDVEDITLDTIANFPNQGAYQNYRPHITLGFGSLNSLKNITLNSTIEGLFICQLANYCTCARILKSFPFKT